MINTIPVTFLNEDGYNLFGILHKPSGNINKKVAIIILNPGIKSRVAPHRLYVKMAKRFSEIGFNVLRFDYHGMGDSEGEIQEKYVADFYGSIQVGRYVKDTISAMDWMEGEYNIHRFVLTGLCGGPITGLLTGAKDQRVDSLLGLGMPVIIDGSNVDHTKYITKGQLKGMRETYLKRLFEFKSWIRFFSFKSDYRLIFKSLIFPIRKKSNKDKLKLDRVPNSDNSLIQYNNNMNPYFQVAFHQMLASRKIFLIFSEADRLFWEFEEKYMKYYKYEIDKYKNNINIDIIKNANHIFSYKEWQEEMLDKSCVWLAKCYNNKS